MSPKSLCQNNFGCGVEYGKPVAKERGITKDLGKQDSNNFYSFKIFGDREEMWCQTVGFSG